MSQTKTPCSRVRAPDDARTPHSHIDAGRDRREHARSADRVGGYEGRIAREQRDGDAHLGVLRALADLGDDPTDCEPDRDPAGGGQHEVQARVREREASADDRGDGDAEGDQRGCVVEQALALDDADLAAGRVEPAHDHRAGERVGGGDDRPEHERDLPGHAGYELVRDCRDRAHRHQDETDAGDRDRPEVPAQIAEVREEGGAVEQRGQEDDEHDVRIEVHLGQAGDETEKRAADDEHDRVGDRKATRERAEAGDGNEQPGDQ